MNPSAYTSTNFRHIYVKNVWELGLKCKWEAAAVTTHHSTLPDLYYLPYIFFLYFLPQSSVSLVLQ